MVTRLGFIGLGKMGGPMARNLLNAGFEVVVHDISEGPVKEMVKAGATFADSPAAVARESEVVWIMVHSDYVPDVLMGDHGVLKGTAPGTVVVDGGKL